MSRFCAKFAISCLLISSVGAYAAQPVDLSRQPASTLQRFMMNMSSAMMAGSRASTNKNQDERLVETRRETDFNQTQHIRIRQTYKGYPVWGANGVVHVRRAGKSTLSLAMLSLQPNQKGTTMNGTVYDNLSADLNQVPASMLTEARADVAMARAVKLAKQDYAASSTPTQQKKQLIVFVDKDKKAHWAYSINMYIKTNAPHPIFARPNYILDATSLDVLHSWNGIHAFSIGEPSATEDSMPLVSVKAGGLGGNKKENLYYDGHADHLSQLTLSRSGLFHLCYYANKKSVVYDYESEHAVRVTCHTPDVGHDNAYWVGDFDKVNGANSPSNDAMYAGSIIQAMYENEYGVPMLVNKDGKPMLLRIVVHIADFSNASWDPEASIIFLGDGDEEVYPLTSLGVMAHEISHGFTQQHSDLIYEDVESGGINEAFSDMAAQAAEYYVHGKSSWKIGAELLKVEDPNGAFRFMDEPTKTCKPDDVVGLTCAVAHRNDIKPETNVHYSSGVYNRVFYLLATTPGWNVKKAFQVMLQANKNYWVAQSKFDDAACGVMKATADYQYSQADVSAAFSAVGIDTQNC